MFVDASGYQYEPMFRATAVVRANCRLQASPEAELERVSGHVPLMLLSTCPAFQLQTRRLPGTPQIINPSVMVVSGQQLRL